MIRSDPPIDLNKVAIRLTNSELQHPLSVIEDYCEEYEMGYSRNLLDQLVKTALLKDDRYNNSYAREELLCWSERLQKLSEAIHIVLSLIMAGQPLAHNSHS